MAVEALARSALLEARQLVAGYNGAPVVHGIDLEVDAGEVVGLLGPNGAGKTTTVLTLAGALKPVGGLVLSGGTPTTSPLHRRARLGQALVTEERSIFFGMSVLDNLRVGDADVDLAVELFPELQPLLRTRAGLLSGGEQQMLTLGRSLARRPRLLLADELSLGLAPLVVRRLLRAVRAAADEGVGVLLVEQHLREALSVSDRLYVLQRGRIVDQGTAEELRGRLATIEHQYLS